MFLILQRRHNRKAEGRGSEQNRFHHRRPHRTRCCPAQEEGPRHIFHFSTKGSIFDLHQLRGDQSWAPRECPTDCPAAGGSAQSLAPRCPSLSPGQTHAAQAEAGTRTAHRSRSQPAQSAPGVPARLANDLLQQQTMNKTVIYRQKGDIQKPFQTSPPPPALSAPTSSSFPTRSELRIDWLPVNGNNFAECHLNKCISQPGVRSSS